MYAWKSEIIFDISKATFEVLMCGRFSVSSKMSTRGMNAWDLLRSCKADCESQHVWHPLDAYKTNGIENFMAESFVDVSKSYPGSHHVWNFLVFAKDYTLLAMGSIFFFLHL